MKQIDNRIYMLWQYIGVLLLAGLMIMCLPSVSAEYQSHKQNTEFNLVIDGGNASECNYTYIQFPDNIVVSTYQVMTKVGTTFNYTIPASNFTQLGSVCMGVSCYDASATPPYEAGSVCREITTTGITGGSLPLLIIFFIGACIFLIMSIAFENYLLGYLSGILFMVSGIYVMIYGIGFMADLYTRVISMVSIGIGISILLIAAYEQLEYAEFGGGSEE